MAESLPKCSLGLAITILLTQLRVGGSSNLSDAVIANLPDSELRVRAREVLDAARLAVGETMLRQSIFALSLVVPLMVIALVVALAVSIVRNGTTGLASLPVAVARGVRGVVIPILNYASVAGMNTWMQEWGAATTRPVLTVVKR